MGLFWRKSVKLGPVRPTGSRRGVETSIGAGPAEVGSAGDALKVNGHSQVLVGHCQRVDLLITVRQTRWGSWMMQGGVL